MLQLTAHLLTSVYCPCTGRRSWQTPKWAIRAPLSHLLFSDIFEVPVLSKATTPFFIAFALERKEGLLEKCCYFNRIGAFNFVEVMKSCLIWSEAYIGIRRVRCHLRRAFSYFNFAHSIYVRQKCPTKIQFETIQDGTMQSLSSATSWNHIENCISTYRRDTILQYDERSTKRWKQSNGCYEYSLERHAVGHHIW